VPKTFIARTKQEKKSSTSITIISTFSFNAQGKNQLTVDRGEGLTLVGDTGNGWSLVQNSRGVTGYVPSSYLQKKS